MAAVFGEPRGVAAKFYGVFLCSEISTTAPGFVADAPELDVEGLRRAGLRAKFGESGTAFRGVAVFNPMRKFLRGKTANVGGEVGFGAYEFAEADEFVGAEFIWLEFVIGGRFVT